MKAALAAALRGSSLWSSLGSKSEEQTPQPGPSGADLHVCTSRDVPCDNQLSGAGGPAEVIRAAEVRTGLDRSQPPTYQAASVVGAAGDMPEASLLRDPQSRG